MKKEPNQPLTGPAISSIGLPLDGAFSFEENRGPRAARVSPLTFGKRPMQGEAKISAKKVCEVIEAVFAQGKPVVYESKSEPEEELRRFDSALALEAEIELRVTDERRFVAYSIYYPETKGVMKKRRRELIPEKNEGKRFRFSADGWGLIQLQLTFEDEVVTCRVAVNSEKRALTWFDTYPDHGDPGLWDWKLVEKHARRIIRSMKKPSRQSQRGRAS